jgi:hypothetical protein
MRHIVPGDAVVRQCEMASRVPRATKRQRWIQ